MNLLLHGAVKIFKGKRTRINYNTNMSVCKSGINRKFKHIEIVFYVGLRKKGK